MRDRKRSYRSGKHVEHESTERPPIDGLVVSESEQDLGRHVLDGATKRVCLRALENRLLAQAEVG